ncbi:MauE/DoxX family redox-associated membrane protein [Streptomyces sp. MS2.AVA.5]|uniref:MauE/DoxX family redox-associated membrane protein n=1 Tax=Streptomyces achmelvichensis TaxID=3134111 RepID=A0ACC6PM61_9ACTN
MGSFVTGVFPESWWWWAHGLLQVYLGALFLVAAWAKMMLTRERRVAWLESVKSLPRWGVAPVAVMLPMVEMAVGVAVLGGAFGVAAPVAAAAVLMLFTLVIVGVVGRGLEVDCGCFGALGRGQMVSVRQILRNVVLLAGCGVLVWFPGGWAISGLPWSAQAVVILTATLMLIAAAWRRRRLRLAAATPATQAVANEDRATGQTAPE